MQDLLFVSIVGQEISAIKVQRTLATADALDFQCVIESEVCDLDDKPPYQPGDSRDIDEPAEDHG